MKYIYFFIFIATILQADNSLIDFKDFKIKNFDPTKGEKLELQVNLKKASSVEIDIVSEDNHLIKKLISKGILKQGTHKFTWDGKDGEGIVVPDEVYSFILKAKDLNQTLDSRDFSGGEELSGIQIITYPDHKIEFNIQKPSRVLLRIGMFEGPLMNTLVNWKPYVQTKNSINWDGKDVDKLVNIPDEKVSSMITAFTLPKYCVVTKGNNKLDYYHYYDAKGWRPEFTPKDKQKLIRDGKKISQVSYLPKLFYKNPKIKLDFINSDSMENNISVYKKGKPIKIKISVLKEDLKIINRLGYEFIFYIDQHYVGEEKDGYVPLLWQYATTDLALGKHTFNINLITFKGGIGIGLKNRNFILK